MSQAPLQPAGLDLNNIQGDVILGMPKKVQECIFLDITDVEAFRHGLKQFIPLITTTTQIQADLKSIGASKQKAVAEARSPTPIIPLVGTNISFSHWGLQKLGQNDTFGDSAFESGQFADAKKNLGDPTDAEGNPKWYDAFKQKIDVLILITGDSWPTVERRRAEICEIFKIGHHHGSSAKLIFNVKCNVRPGKEKGHEHFGFQDGISQPAIEGITDKPFPGQDLIAPGNMLFGEALATDGRPTPSNAGKTPAWAKDGSFLVFRHLEQLVPEFDQFLKVHAIKDPGLTPAQGADLLGARFVGRWKDGTPIDVSPNHPNHAIAKDPQRNNNFDFSEVKDQSRCPFAAHVRKTNPRSDLNNLNPQQPHAFDNRRIIRQGIQFGPEMTREEIHENKTHHKRGLAFICYQASIVDAFQFLQQSWAGNANFPPGKNVPIGLDPIIGQKGNDARDVSGMDPDNQNADPLQLPFDFVVPKGGEYFFVPSISALKNTLAL